MTTILDSQDLDILQALSTIQDRYNLITAAFLADYTYSELSSVNQSLKRLKRAKAITDNLPTLNNHKTYKALIGEWIKWRF